MNQNIDLVCLACRVGNCRKGRDCVDARRMRAAPAIEIEVSVRRLDEYYQMIQEALAVHMRANVDNERGASV